MYYPFVAKYLQSSNGDRDIITFVSLVNDYSCDEYWRNVKIIFGLHGKHQLPFNEFFFVYNDQNHIILGNDKYSFISEGRLYNMKRVDEYKLRYRFYKFLLRLVHDADKAFGSMDMCLKFLHDYSAGAAPADLLSKYCWYRTFGGLLNENSDVFHETNF